MQYLYKDIRTNQIVRVTKEINTTTVMVIRIKDKMRYITDVSNLRKLAIKQSRKVLFI